MTDLLHILPSFRTAPFGALLPIIEQHALSTTDLLALHPADISKQTNLPLLDLKRLIATIQVSLSDDLVPRHPLQTTGSSPREGQPPETSSQDASQSPTARPEAAPAETPRSAQSSPPSFISTLCPEIDAALNPGIPTSSITEITGESGAGKTQFLLSLCLAVQLPPPRGLGKQALYVSTESSLATKRLSQILASNPLLQAVDPPDRPSLDNILSTVTPDLESQDHILEYQVPVLLSRHSIGLIVIDSVAANYRAEFERAGSSYGSNMAARGAELVRLGALLRHLARKHDIAVVVANQVSDRFSSSAPVPSTLSRGRTCAEESPLASRSAPPPPQSSLAGTPSSSVPPFSLPDDASPPAHPALRLDHQQRWFTGWGDDPRSWHSLKTPSLGLVWSTQIGCRIALFKSPVYGRPRHIAAPIEADDDDVDRGPTLRSWRRWIKVVFAGHVAASGQGVTGAKEFEVTTGGIACVPGDEGNRGLW
ncbi:DNA recombination and repair protein Rad51 [Metarhizium album ARSEF 1941]|uniref:DNA recombination and repair protein Rad51 n=1 Tax=Metarhizium album (strain ARSEF 1941) TaxID=1081103 RepID=A0A0B2WIL1_METAS|nr:DNA recombination and repair protein Rad51 [Metarhizium album ARSEF 1941]KHN95871.1 DNA recombination and repair protein Rad51 [Metarhizium album ARSEF 1941]